MKKPPVIQRLRYYAGGEVRDVRAAVGKVDSWFATSFNAIVTFDTGVTAVLLVNWRSGTRRLTLELHATDAVAYMDADGLSTVYWDNSAEPTDSFSHTEAAGSEERHVHQGFRAQSRAFVDAVKTRRPPHNNLGDAVKTMELVDAIYAVACPVPDVKKNTNSTEE